MWPGSELTGLLDGPEGEEGQGGGHQYEAVDHLYVLLLQCLHQEGLQHLGQKQGSSWPS